MTNGKDGGWIPSGSSQLSGTEIKFRCNTSALTVPLLGKDKFAYKLDFAVIEENQLINEIVSLCCWTEPNVVTNSNSLIFW